MEHNSPRTRRNRSRIVRAPPPFHSRSFGVRHTHTLADAALLRRDATVVMLQDGQRHGQLRLDTTITIRLLLAAAGKMLSGSLSEERVRQSGREPRCWRWFSVSARRPFNIPIVCISAETERKASSSAHTVASRLLDRRLGETKSVFSKCILRQCVLRAYSARACSASVF